jgi:hypothetical protein
MNAEALRNACDLVSRVNAFSTCFLKVSFRNLDCLRFVHSELTRTSPMKALAQLLTTTADEEQSNRHQPV